MRSKLLFWILVVLVFGSLIAMGFLYAKDNLKMLWIIEGVTVIAILLFVTLYRRLIKPYQILLNGMELMNEQDFSSRLRSGQNSEANRLIAIFNRMMDQLKSERLQVREKNQFLDLLINASPQGVIILGAENRVSEINPSGIKLLKTPNSQNIKGRKLSELDSELGAHLANLQSGDDTVVRTTGLGAYHCVRSSFVDSGFDHPFILIEELTYELLKIEKESYDKIIRMMSHEVNNSIGAIGGTLNVISDIMTQSGQDEWTDVLPVVNASMERCKHLADFTSNLANLVKIPDPSPSEVSLNELIRSVEALTRFECQRRNIQLHLQLADTDQTIYIDGIQFEQVLVNIIKNAYEAIGTNGEISIISQTNPLSIIVENNGQPIDSETKRKLFSPFFTTKSSGQGIGLMFVREVLTSHNCKFDLNSENGLTRFTIELE